MSTITITINTDSAAFEDAGGSEVARILRELATRYDEGGFYIHRLLKDANGNAVGTADLGD